MFKKLIKSLPVLAIFLFLVASSVKANGLLRVYSVNMPDYINYDPFKISYTAIQAEDKSVHTIGYLAKEGASWINVGESDKLSDTFTIDGGILSGDGAYKIYFASSDGMNNAQSSEETFTIDRHAPGPVSDYKKERKDTFLYRICWKNPDEEDFDRVVVYRSDKKEFQADSSTQIAEVGGTKNEDKCYDNGIPESKDYYYVTRVVDHAGNISGVVGDSEVTVTTVLGASVTVTPTPTAVGLPLAKVSPQPTSEVEEGQILGGETSKAAESKPGVIQSLNATIVKFGFWKIVGIIVIVLGIVILLVSLLKKRH